MTRALGAFQIIICDQLANILKNIDKQSIKHDDDFGNVFCICLIFDRFWRQFWHEKTYYFLIDFWFIFQLNPQMHEKVQIVENIRFPLGKSTFSRFRTDRKSTNFRRELDELIVLHTKFFILLLIDTENSDIQKLLSVFFIIFKKNGRAGVRPASLTAP